MLKTIAISTLILLSGCSNMSIGFEENSVFYTPPKESLQEKTEKTIEKVSPKSLQNIEQENETTFSYDPYTGE